MLSVSQQLISFSLPHHKLFISVQLTKHVALKWKLVNTLTLKDELDITSVICITRFIFTSFIFLSFANMLYFPLKHTILIWIPRMKSNFYGVWGAVRIQHMLSILTDWPNTTKTAVSYVIFHVWSRQSAY